ncbi:MAG: hypothetical protein DLM69_00125 [Candidatus Chloroheliales bacterium]|nr:MAG: hypothetical protein DLM69_00125 [Chloroflexota bacterium]
MSNSVTIQFDDDQFKLLEEAAAKVSRSLENFCKEVALANANSIMSPPPPHPLNLTRAQEDALLVLATDPESRSPFRQGRGSAVPRRMVETLASLGALRSTVPVIFSEQGLATIDIIKKKRGIQ